MSRGHQELFERPRNKTPGNRVKGPQRHQSLGSRSARLPKASISQLLRRQPEVQSARDASNLLRLAHADNGRGDCGIVQCPGDGDLTRRPAMPVADLTKQFDKLKIAREFGLLKLDILPAPVILRAGWLLARQSSSQSASPRSWENIR